ncbi:MAG: class I SAM-dependent methyltransferase [Nitrospirae bacterium]|nr:class I SAM-dependent methyltransferase [Nitrospirota bacterium]MBI5694655.1 class I SAM-dependent methyltransferase [Nitrospirota bacterium]
MFFDWPDGLAWRMLERTTFRLRRRKFDFFMETARPGPEESLLDVGVAGFIGRATDFLEMWYPYRRRITAIGIEKPAMYRAFRDAYPEVRVMVGDGAMMPFRDGSFDLLFSNAVLEHAGDRERQKKFVHECVRVAGRGFITTPSYWFPLESHTLLPFVHYLPYNIKRRIYGWAGKGFWADPELLNLLTEDEFVGMFPPGVRTVVSRQRLMGITATIWVYFEHAGNPDSPASGGRTGSGQ